MTAASSLREVMQPSQFLARNVALAQNHLAEAPVLAEQFLRRMLVLSVTMNTPTLEPSAIGLMT